MTCHFFPLLAPGWRKRERGHTPVLSEWKCVCRTTVGAKWYNHSWQLLHVHLTGQPFPNGFIHHPLFILCALLNSRFYFWWWLSADLNIPCREKTSDVVTVSALHPHAVCEPAQASWKKKKQIAGIFSPAGPAVPLSVIEAGTRALSQPHTHSEVIFKPINPP